MDALLRFGLNSDSWSRPWAWALCFDLPALCPGSLFFLAFPPGLTSPEDCKSLKYCLSGGFTMIPKDLSRGNRCHVFLPSSFVGEGRKRYERKEKKKIPESKQDDLMNLLILIPITRNFYGTVEAPWADHCMRVRLGCYSLVWPRPWTSNSSSLLFIYLFIINDFYSFPL